MSPVTMDPLPCEDIFLRPVLRKNIKDSVHFTGGTGDCPSTINYIFYVDRKSRLAPTSAQHALHLLFGFLTGVFVFTTLAFPKILSTCPASKSSVYESAPLFKSPQCRRGKNEKELLFVGVMTSKTFVNTRARVLFQTWGEEVPGKLAFFSSGNQSSVPDLPIVKLPGVDDTYPPQKKSFLMLKFMYDNLLDDYEWFIRADDDVFFKTEELESFLRSIDSSKTWYIGQPGRGTVEEFGKLHLENDENFCMGGPGMILSKETLRRIGPHIRDCLHTNIFTTHEDVEVGRCVRKYAGVSCTWNYEMAKILMHNGTYRESFISPDRIAGQVRRAVSFHPIKIPAVHHRLLQFTTRQKIATLRKKLVRVKRFVAKFSHEPNASKLTAAFGFEKFRNNRESSSSLIRKPAVWQHFDRWSKHSAGCENPRKTPGKMLKDATADVIDDFLLQLNDGAHRKGRIFEYSNLNFGYWRNVPAVGVEYVMNLAAVRRQHSPKKSTSKTRLIAAIRRPYADLEFQEIQLHPSKINDAEKRQWRDAGYDGLFASFWKIFMKAPSYSLEPVHFVLTLAGRLENFRRFMQYWESACFPEESCTITVVLFSTGDPERDFMKEKEEIFYSVKRRHPTTPMRLLRAKGAFNRGIGVELGASFYTSNALLFICDVDLVFTQDLIDRIRRGTVLGRRVYYPIMYSEFNTTFTFSSRVNGSFPTARSEFNSKLDSTGSKHRSFNSSSSPYSPEWHQSANCFTDAQLGDVSGYWRQFSYGMVGIYNLDLRRVGGFDLSIRGWGKEDADLIDKVVKAGLEVFRATDVGLYHVHHPVRCDRTLPTDQLVQCLNTQLQTFLSTKVLGEMLLPVKDSFQFRPDVSADILP